jgi:VanZ family protein
LSVAATERTFLNKFLIYWLPVLVVATVIISLGEVPHLQPPLQFPNSDKLFHALEFGALGTMLSRALKGSLPGLNPWLVFMITTVCAALVGGCDEYFQQFVPGRESSLLDLAADVTGAVLAQVVFWRHKWR